MALYADIANRSRTNSLRMARPSRYKSATQRRLTAKIKKTVQKYNVRSIQSQRQAPAKPNPFTNRANAEQAARLKSIRALSERSVRRLDNRYAGAEKVQDSRVRRALGQITQEFEILRLLSPAARTKLGKAGMDINLRASGTMPSYNPFFKDVNIPVNLGEDEIRHELTHAGLALTPDLFPDVSDASKFANTALGTFMGYQDSLFLSGEQQMRLAEEPALTMGGQEAYPGFTPSNVPSQFADFFNTQDRSWQYPTQTKWKIGK